MTGFFDSGLGGLCIYEAFLKACPEEPTVYIADSGNCPYGNRPAEEIRAIADRIVAELIEVHHCDLIVVACNTATAAAIDFLRAKYPEVPFVGLEPAIKPAALHSKSGVVGVIATRGTFNGRLYRETSARFAKDVTVLTAVADEWVQLVERGAGGGLPRTSGPTTPVGADVPGGPVYESVRKVVEPLVKAGADHLVLGCTHFPHLKNIIQQVAGPAVTVLDPSAAVAAQARRLLNDRR